MSTKYIASNWRLPNQENSSKNDNYGLSFDGSSEFIDCGSPTLFDDLTSFSFSCWFNSDVKGNDDGILGKWNTGTDRSFALNLETSGASSNIRFAVFNSGGTVVQSYINGSDWSTGNWYNVIGTYDGSNVKLYLDGVLKDTVALTGTVRNATQSFRIGVYGSASYFDGKISEVAVFDYALSESQISTLYGSSSLGAGNPMALKPQPVAFYPLGDNSASNPLTQPNEAVEDASVFDFDGSSYIIIPTDTSLNSISDTVSISQWVKFTGTSQQYITNFGNDYGTYVNNGKFAVVFRDTGNAQIVLSSTVNINDGEWHHVLAVKTTTNLYIYIDGGAAESNSNGDTGRTSTRSNAIGALFNGSIKFTGNISNVAVWDSDQSSEISNIYNSGVPATTYTNTPTAWYKLDQSANWEADSSGAWQIPDAVSAYPQSFDFDGSQYINIADSDSLSFGNGTTDSPFSISAWVNFYDMTSSAIITKRFAGNNKEYSFHFLSTNKIQFTLFSQLSGTVISRYYNTALTSYENQWIHLVGTYDGSSSSNGIKIYLNGNRIDDTTYNSGTYVAMSNGASSVRLGLRPNSSFAKGKISNAQIYDIELSSSQVETLYNNGTPLTTAIATDNLKLWAKLDNTATFSTNWSIPDASGNGNTGTSSGMTEQNLVNNNVSALNGESSGMTSASLVLSDLTRAVPYDSYSFSFDGANDLVSAGNVLGFERTDAFSISAWVKRNSSKNQMIVSKRLSSGDLTGYSLRITNSTNQLQVQLRSAGSNRLIVDGSTALDTNWNHVVLTYDGSSNISGLNIYLNGSNDNGSTSGTLSSSILNSAEFNIGAENNNDDFFDGKISNVSIFNEELTSTEVLKLYSNGMPQDLSSFSPAPISWWTLGSNSFFNGTNYICRDLIGSNDGTSANAAAAAIVGDSPRSEANGVGTNNSIPENLVGTTKYSSNNSWSINMSETARVEDTP